MQKLIAKYGLAVHLAGLAVAPLFLFPYVAGGTVAVVLLWLALYSSVWMLLAPSVRVGERMHDARRRVLGRLVRDPSFWVLVVVVVLAGVAALNTGIRLAYDAENSHWFVSTAVLSFFPGCVGEFGFLPFAALLASTVVLMACRHALGRSARMVFLLVASVAAGLAAGAALLALFFGVAGARAAMSFGDSPCTCVGFAFGIYFLAALVAVLMSFERQWNLAAALVMFAIGGNAVGAFVFAPPHISAAFAVVGALLLGLVFAFACVNFGPPRAFRLLVVVVVALALGGLAVVALLPEGAQAERLSAFRALTLVPSDFWVRRATGSAIAVKSWLSHLWVGTGIGSYSLDFSFCASDADWRAFPGGLVRVANGWWQILAEQGLVGLVSFALPLAFLVWVWGGCVLRGARVGLIHPVCLLAPILILLFVVAGFFDCSFLRADALMAVYALSAISAGAFRRVVKDGR